MLLKELMIMVTPENILSKISKCFITCRLSILALTTPQARFRLPLPNHRKVSETTSQRGEGVEPQNLKDPEKCSGTFHIYTKAVQPKLEL